MSNDYTALTIRNAAPDDASAIGALYRQLVSDPHVRVDSSRIQTILHDPRTCLFVCDVNGQVVATALVSLCFDVMYGDQPFAVVENVVVDTQHRGNGIGEKLLHEIERFCADKDCSKITLTSSASRVDAHRFFERVGFLSDAKRAFVKYRRQFSLTH
ncbi:GNAT family N-acetyltransferase [Pararobbsia alpina]|uniref:GNAT family N-acetyltransferase n=1 Tax=Pararobbsia alpina TaxID=621374 RepID=UPI0039A6AD2C